MESLRKDDGDKAGRSPATGADLISLIRLSGVSRRFDSPDGETVDVLADLDLAIEPGSFTVIRGESGSGKTTLLRILGMLDTSYTGRYTFSGTDLGDRPDWFLDEMRSANIGFIFQEGRLFDHLTLRRNIDLPLHLQRPGEAGDAAVDALSEPFFENAGQMQDVLSRIPAKTSGGQKQRASIIRAIAARPALVLADEPTASLHIDLKRKVVEHLHALSEQGHTVVVVSHDDVFYDKGRQLELKDGTLIEVDLPATGVQDSDAPPPISRAEIVADVPVPIQARMPQEGRALLWGWKPRSGLRDLTAQAWRDMVSRPLFLALILSALAVGACQVSVFASIITGSGAFIEEQIRQGSRLNRIQIKPRTVDLPNDNRFPMRGQIAAWPQVDQVVPRRTMTVRFALPTGRTTSFTAMGLQANDPEYDLLVFSAGGEFSDGHDGLEIIVTTDLLSTLFSEDETTETGQGELDDGYFDRYVGRTAEALIPRFNNAGTLVETVPINLRVVGIILHAEGDRQLYLPSLTVRALDRFKRDRTGDATLPLNEDATDWTDRGEVARMADFPWEDNLQVYLKSIDTVIPTLGELGRMGLSHRSEIWKFKWALDIRETAFRIFVPLLGLIVLGVAITVFANIFTGAKLRESELALWRILGMRRGDLVATQVMSTAASVAVGTAAGLSLGYLLIQNSKALLRRSAEEQAAETNTQAQNFEVLFAPVGDFFTTILVGALVIGILAALYPAYRTARTDPAKVLRG